MSVEREDGVVSLRRRKHEGDSLRKDPGAEIKENLPAPTTKLVEESQTAAPSLSANTFWLTRILFIRSLGFIYCKWLYFFIVTVCNYSL